MGVAWHRFLAFSNIFFKRSGTSRPALGALRPMLTDGAGRSTSSRPTRRRTSSASPRSSSSPGRACSTSPPAPSAAAASRSARPGTPASRCRRSCWCCRLRDHAYAKAPYLLAGGGMDHDRRGEGDPGAARRGQRAGAGRGRAAADRRRRRRRRHRPGRAVVLHHLRRLRRAVPGRHRARRPHRRHAPLPGDDRVELPVRGRRDAAQPGDPRATRGARRRPPARTGPRAWTSRCPGSPTAATSSTCSGSAAPAPSRTGPRRPPAPSPRCCTRPASASRILGNGETCTGDPARRIGNEFVFQMLAQQNVETLNSAGVKKIVATCPHCFNTLANEYAAARRRVRGGPPHPAAGAPGGGGKLTPVSRSTAA